MRIKKADIILTIIIIAAAIFVFVIYNLVMGGFGKGFNGEVVITVDGAEFGRYELTKDQEIEIGNTNKAVIKDGYVDMIWADCPDKLCVNHVSINKAGNSIICLPNKVVITIENTAGKSEIDTMAQ